MSKINIKPLADRVLVEPSEAETKTSSGIIIPDSAKEKPQKGKIVAVGPGTKEVESNGGPVSTDTKEPAPVKVATAKDMGVTGPGDVKDMKPAPKPKSAE